MKNIPHFCGRHSVKHGDTLRSIADMYGFENPGPIVAFNADHLDAIAHKGQRRKLPAQSWHEKEKTPANRPYDYDRLESNQINRMALSLDDPSVGHGRILEISTIYDTSAPLDPMKNPYLVIPWTRKAVQEYIDLHLGIRRDILKGTANLINSNRQDLKDLKEVLLAVDLAAAVFSGGKDVFKLAKSGTNLGKTVQVRNWRHAFLSKNSVEITADFLEKEALKLLALKAARTIGAGKKANDVNVERVIMGLRLPKLIRLKKGFGFALNNTLGWLSPSKWTGTYAAIVEGDADIAWWGAEAVDAKTVNSIIMAAHRRLADIDPRLRAAIAVRDRAFYDHIVYPYPRM